MKTLLIEMPDDWDPDMCPDCHIDYSGCVGICGGKPCPLARAKEATAVKSGDIDRVLPDDILAHGKPVKLYAVREGNR
jgi:hypothetical protein